MKIQEFYFDKILEKNELEKRNMSYASFKVKIAQKPSKFIKARADN